MLVVGLLVECYVVEYFVGFVLIVECDYGVYVKVGM